MKIKCGNCGRDIVVPDDIVAGQHIRCPYCNEKSAFDRPTRIEIPTGIKMERPSSAETSKQKPDLSIRRPARESKDREHTNMAAQAIRERIANAERRVRIIKWKRRFHDFTVWIVLLGAVALCYFGWRMFRAVAPSAQLPDVVTKIVTNTVEKIIAPNVETASETSQDVGIREPLEEAVAGKGSSAKLSKEERERNVDAYALAVFSYRDKKFAMANHGKIMAALGSRTGTFYFCFPTDASNVPLYAVNSAADGQGRVTKMSETGDACEIPFVDFTNRLDQSDYLMAHGQQVCFRALRAQPATGRLSVVKNVDATALFFGNLYKAVKELELVFDNVTFEILFMPQDSQKQILVQTIDFGCDYSLAEVRGALVEAIPLKAKNEAVSGKVKKFKRTVLFWDGNMIKQGIGGEFYVPRTFVYHGPRVRYYGHGWIDRFGHHVNRMWSIEQARERWESLYRRAKEEEAEERAYYAEATRRFEAAQSKVAAETREKWKKSIDDMLQSGTLTYRAKIK